MLHFRAPFLGLLTFLLLAWGTCPCFYADVLSGGTVQCEVARACGEGCGTDADDPCDDGDDGCPCQDAFGCMHPLPKVEESSSRPDPAARICALVVEGNHARASAVAVRVTLQGAALPAPPPAHPPTDILLV